MGLVLWHCKKCGYDWAGRGEKKKPTHCANPKCRTRRWDIAPVKKKAKTEVQTSGG